MAKKKDTMTDITLSGMVGLNVVGAIPAPASAAGIKAGFSTGVSNVGTALPVMGKVKGTGMVMKAVKKLKPETLEEFEYEFKCGKEACDVTDVYQALVLGFDTAACKDKGAIEKVKHCKK